MLVTIKNIAKKVLSSLCIVYLSNTPGLSNVTGFYFHIKDEISSEQFDNIKYLLDAYQNKIDIGDLRVIKLDYFSVIRIIKEEFCEQGFCINIIFRNCAEQRCKSTTVIASDKFRVERVPRDDLGLAVQFPTRVEGNYTSVIVNARYVAALQGL